MHHNRASMLVIAELADDLQRVGSRALRGEDGGIVGTCPVVHTAVEDVLDGHNKLAVGALEGCLSALAL